LRRGLAVDAQAKSIEVDFSDAGLAFLDRNGTVSAATPGNKTPHVEIQMTVTEQGEVQFQVRAVAGEKLAVVDEAGKAREVTATYRPLREGEKLRVGGKEFTWFGPRSREGLALKAKVLTKFNGQILIEDVFKVDERAGWAEGFVKKWEQEFVGRESMFGDPARAFAERARKDPRLSDPEYRAAFATRCDNVLAALRPIVDKYSG
jgi:hypothetical protein